MKKILMAVFFAVVLAFGGSALALTINDGSIEVGGVDQYYASTYLFPPNDGNEETWIQSVLTEEYYISGSTSVNDSMWIQTDQQYNGEYAFAYDLAGTPDYFFMFLASQPGIVDPDYRNMFLFENLASFEWAVIQLSQLEGYYPPGGEINIGRISHIREIGGTPVPEPGMVILLGIGLLGLAFYNRKRLLN